MNMSEIPSILNNLRTLLSLAPAYYNNPEGAKQWAYSLKSALPYDMRERAKQYYLPLIQNRCVDAFTLESEVKAAEEYIKRQILELEKLKTPKLNMQWRLWN